MIQESYCTRAVTTELDKGLAHIHLFHGQLECACQQRHECIGFVERSLCWCRSELVHDKFLDSYSVHFTSSRARSSRNGWHLKHLFRDEIPWNTSIAHCLPGESDLLVHNRIESEALWVQLLTIVALCLQQDSYDLDSRRKDSPNCRFCFRGGCPNTVDFVDIVHPPTHVPGCLSFCLVGSTEPYVAGSKGNECFVVVAVIMVACV